jgi:hypothetical protein
LPHPPLKLTPANYNFVAFTTTSPTTHHNLSAINTTPSPDRAIQYRQDESSNYREFTEWREGVQNKHKHAQSVQEAFTALPDDNYG